MSNEKIIEKINANDGSWTPLDGFVFTLEAGDETVWCNQDGGYGCFKVFRMRNSDTWTISNSPNDLQDVVDSISQFAKIVGIEISASMVVEVKEVVTEVLRANPDTENENMRLKTEIGVYEKLLAREFTVKPV